MDLKIVGIAVVLALIAVARGVLVNNPTQGVVMGIAVAIGVFLLQLIAESRPIK